MMQRQLVKQSQSSLDDGKLAAIALLSGESEQRLRVFAKVHQNKAFSKQTAFEAFAGITAGTTRKKTAQ